jgi:hypothetical protein
MKEFITQENIDTNSHIELVKTDISNTIEAIEIPEIPKTDLSNVTE